MRGAVHSPADTQPDQSRGEGACRFSAAAAGACGADPSGSSKDSTRAGSSTPAECTKAFDDADQLLRGGAGRSAMREANNILRTCVHCGFCLATCPTYLLLGDELDSPRGRIYLAKEMLEGGKTPTAPVVKHSTAASPASPA